MLKSPMSDPRRGGWTVKPTLQWSPGPFDDDARTLLLPGVAVPLLVEAEGPHRAAPREVEGRRAEGVQPEVDSDARIRIRAVFSAEQQRYTVHSIGFAVPEGADVSSVMLRTTAPVRILRWVLPGTFAFDQGECGPYAALLIAPEQVDRDQLPPPTLEDAAAVYRLAGAVREARANSVSEILGLPVRTASRWIARAKEQGLLDGGLEGLAAERAHEEMENLRDIAFDRWG